MSEQPKQLPTLENADERKPNDRADFDKWLESFYKECGREVTLAYTTLNQMKNWAVAIVAAVLSAVVALSKSGEIPQNSQELLIFFGAAVAYVFALRFFVRAVICYNNLVRWNNLQTAIVDYKLVSRAETGTATAADQKRALEATIRELYHQWRVPSRMTRPNQILSNLKLGFGLLLLLPLLFVVAYGIRVANAALGLAMITFCVGYTAVEMFDFMRSTLFDTPEAFARRPKKEQPVFPTPVYGKDYFLGLLLTFLASVLVAVWPQLRPIMARIMCLQ
jgi:hypothetical protein